jgi:hypothetical protein
VSYRSDDLPSGSEPTTSGSTTILAPPPSNLFGDLDRAEVRQSGGGDEMLEQRQRATACWSEPAEPEAARPMVLRRSRWS